MRLKTAEVIQINAVLEKIVSQSIEYPLNIAYKLHKVKQSLNDLELFVYDRLAVILGSAFGDKNLSEEQQLLYNSVMMSEVDIENQNLSLEEILSDKVKLDIESVPILLKIFPEKAP